METVTKSMFNSLPLTMNTTLTSNAMQLWDAWGYAVQVVITGTPTGTFKLQGSVDPIIKGNPTGQFPQTPTNWTDVDQSSYTITAAGNFVWNVFEVGYNYVRLIYTDASSGASTAQLTVATFNSKGV